MTVWAVVVAVWAMFLAGLVAGWWLHAAVARAQRGTFEVDFTRRRVGK